MNNSYNLLMGETEIQSTVKKFLQYHRFEVERISNTPLYNKYSKSWRPSSMTPGISDLHFFRKDKRGIATGWLEIKIPADYTYLMKHYAEIKKLGPSLQILKASKQKFSSTKLHLYNQIIFIEDKIKAGMVCGFIDGIDRVLELFDKNGIKLQELNLAV